ncbi:ATP-binding protein [Rhodoluna limnophila]|uniref:ATP-binding protein n=1 Tax=Rhodoluna limnophila TaxID=232537 RepID=UPI001106F128|nr:ATP-binding protein [Rhodoluna limnophila]
MKDNIYGDGPDGIQGDDSFDVNIQPDVSALRMFKSMSFTPWYALGEFVDNSLTSAMKFQEELLAINGPDYKVRIQIDFSPETNDLVIKDNAAGISRQEMQRALRMGKAPQDISVGLSRHGVGMKAAAFWWGARLEIKTYPLGEPHGWLAILDVSEDGEMQGTVTVKPIPSRGFPGSEIRIKGLWQKIPAKKTKHAIRAYLPSIYRSFLGGGAGGEQIGCVLVYEGTELRYENPALLTAPFWPTKDGQLEGAEPRLWKHTFDKTLSTGKRVTGWYGILETMGRDKSGFFLHYRGKGIAGVVPVAPLDSRSGHEAEGAKDAIARSSYKPRRIFGDAGLYPDQSFIGEFDVSDFGKTISTDSPLWSPDEEEEFVEALFLEMTEDDNNNFLKMAKNYRRRGVARETQREIAAAREQEIRRVQESMSGVVEHREVSENESQHYEAPPSLETPVGVEQVDEGGPTKYTIQDRDDHDHTFNLEFVSDRSADFISVYEDRGGLSHTVRVNSSHPMLDGIPLDAKTLLLLERIAFALASAEVFLTMMNKQRVRETMNEHLRLIGTKEFND